jgi:RNA polymerase sigma-70 factor (ECF subfamily)
MKGLEASRELELLGRARQESTRKAALTELVIALREPVFALCLHLVGSRAEAEDAVQETLLAVHQGLDSFRGEARLSTWVYRIAIRTAQKRRARRGSDEAISESLPDPAPGPLEAVVARQRSARLLAALDELSADQRTVLALFAVEGLRHGQIAEVLGIPEGTVWSRLHLSRKRLAALLGPEGA